MSVQSPAFWQLAAAGLVGTWGHKGSVQQSTPPRRASEKTNLPMIHVRVQGGQLW